MKTEKLLKHFLPSEIIDNFDLVKINEIEDKDHIEMRIYLDSIGISFLNC